MNFSNHMKLALHKALIYGNDEDNDDNDDNDNDDNNNNNDNNDNNNDKLIHYLNLKGSMSSTKCTKNKIELQLTSF